MKISLFALTAFSASVLGAVTTMTFFSADVLRGRFLELDRGFVSQARIILCAFHSNESLPNRMSTASVRPPAQPAIMPTRAPANTVRAPATTAMNSDIRAP